MTRVAVVGSGRRGAPLLERLREHPEVELVAVADVTPGSPVLQLARKRRIPTVIDGRAVFHYAPEMVFEATRKPDVLEDLLRERPAGTEVIGARSTRFLWDYIDARERTTGRLETLLLLSQTLTSALEPETIFDLIAEAAVRLLDVEAAGLWTVLEHSGVPTLSASAGAAEPLARSSTAWPLLEELVREVAQGKKGGAQVARVEGVGTFAGVPLRNEGRVLGVLGVVGPVAPLTEADQDLLDSFASQAAIAVENARLYDTATRAVQTLNESQEKFVQLERLRALGEMASGVAHDFNNILAVILGWIQLVRPQLEAPLLSRAGEVIERMAWDGARVVRRIQEFARIRRGQPFVTVGVNELVHEVLEATRPRWKDQAEAQGIRYEVVSDLGEIPTGAGDPSELREALMNLVLNAFDAMPQGGTLRIRTAFAEGSVAVTVSDTGCGMSEELKRHAFEPFFTTKGAHSTGLGLAMTHEILQRHGGTIGIESREGQGTTFTIRLPAGTGVADDREVEPPRAAPRRATILVIDDEEEVRTVLGEILRMEGHSVRAAASGKEGLASFRDSRPDMVLTDLGMPEMSGWQVARAVKALSRETPVILVTGWGEELDAQTLREGRVDFVLLKPFRKEKVLNLVVRALERSASPR